MTKSYREIEAEQAQVNFLMALHGFDLDVDVVANDPVEVRHNTRYERLERERARQTERSMQRRAKFSTHFA